MKTSRKPKKVTASDIKKELRKAELNFQRIVGDKSLPSFGTFFMACLVTGTAENVNLKSMFPEAYTKLNVWVKEHKEEILAMRE